MASPGVKEIAVSTADPDGVHDDDYSTRDENRRRLSLDWWATIVAGVVVLLAVVGLLPRIPW